MDLARKPTEKLAPDLDRGLFGDIEGTDFGRKIWPWDRSLFRIIRATENHGFGGSPRQATHIEIHRSPNSPAGAPRSPGDRRKRQPLGAGKHAAELG